MIGFGKLHKMKTTTQKTRDSISGKEIDLDTRLRISENGNALTIRVQSQNGVPHLKSEIAYVPEGQGDTYNGYQRQTVDQAGVKGFCRELEKFLEGTETDGKIVRITGAEELANIRKGNTGTPIVRITYAYVTETQEATKFREYLRSYQLTSY
ncbi:hypothetical protein COV18_07295 [Candidatus Woesearchaeota archaeon CG10_big_fil_rev_8_21_14_0_10_37_12]|nr:MAG: hypothetical protein COV18_07295 [Candidatus Woesearchaeota archaeon CG10_big_fil_rev_8_21_14_0_10_37_12]